MAVNKRAVKLFYDVLSPYSYMAFEILTRCSKQWKSMDLQLKPVLIAGVMQATNNSPPGLLPARANYMTKDLYRLSEYFEVPFRFPRDVPGVMFQKGSLRAQRLLTAVALEHPDLLETISRQIYLRIWKRDQDITEEHSLKEACLASEVNEELAGKLVAMTNDDKIKETLKTSTAEAVKYGAFGLPAYVIEHNSKPQLMFGVDRIFMLAYYLGEDMPVSRL